MNTNFSRLSHYFCDSLVQDLVLITSTIGGSKLVTKNRSVLGTSPLHIARSPCTSRTGAKFDPPR